MKMTKKIPTLLLAASMLIAGLGSCGKPSASQSSEDAVYSNPVYSPVFAGPCVNESESPVLRTACVNR